MRTFTKSVLLITGFSIVTRIIGFVFRIFLSRLLGAELLGVYQIATSIFMILFTIIGSGLPLVISREVAKLNPKDPKIQQVTGAGLIIGVGTALILCSVVLLARQTLDWLFNDQRCVAILIALMPALVASAIYSVLRAVWWGEKKFLLLGVTELIEQVARVILFVLLLGISFYFADLAHLAAWAFTGACIIAAMVVILIFYKSHHCQFTRQAHTPYLKPLLKAATPITGVRLFASLTAPVISIVLPLRLVTAGWARPTAIAHLGIITGMTLPLLTIPATVISAIATALVPELATLMQKQHWGLVRQKVQTVILFTIFINFCLIPLYLALGIPIGTWLYAEPASGIYLARAAWVMLPMSLSQITNATLNALNQERVTIRNYAYGCLILLTTLWFLPQIIGADAVLLGMGLSMTLSSCLNFVAIRRTTHGHAQTAILINIIKYALLGLPVILIGYCNFHLLTALPLYVNILINVLLAESAFLCLCWCTNLITLPKKR